MGANISTLAMTAADTMSRETMIGVLLAIPFFVQYFKQHMEAFKKDPSQIVSTLQTMSTLQYCSEQDNEIRVVKHRSLMCGSIPVIEPSSEDSVATEKISNHKNRPRVEQVATSPPPTEVVFKVKPSKSHEEEEMGFEAVPVLAIEASEPVPVIVTESERCSPYVTPERPKTRLAPISPVTPVSLDFTPERSMPSETTEAPSPTSTESSKSKKFPVEAVSVVTQETSGETAFEDTSTDESRSSASSSTPEYLESVSRSLARRARKVSHTEKVGIAQALVELGDILLKDDAYRSAMKVYKRAEVIQKIIVDETIASVASAMKQQSDYHKVQGNVTMANLYGNMAEELGAQHTPAVLKKCMDLHHDHKPHGDMDKDLSSLVKKLDRRLKRAGAEAVPLVATLKKQATVAALRR